MALAPARRFRSTSVMFCGLMLLAAACGGDEDGASPPPPSPPQDQVTTVTPPTVGVTTTVGGGTGTTRTIPPATVATPAETPIDQSLVPEKINMDVSFTKATVNGVVYTRALVIDPYNSGGAATSQLQINAGRNRSRFLGEMGVPDDQRSSTAYKVDISFDLAAPVLSTEIRFGETKKIDLDVTGVLRIKIVVSPISATASCCDPLAIGEARLR